MTEPIPILRCPDCSRQSVLGYSNKVAILRSQGKLRREKNPDPELVDALLEAALPGIACRQCGSSGLRIELQEEEESPEFWGERRRCADCQEPIPAERLEIFPDADRCAACQAKASGGDGVEAEFCPRCGDRMVLVARSAGITRFQNRCPACGYRE